MKSSIRLICADNFVQEVINETMPLLILCACSEDHDHQKQVHLIEELAKSFNGILRIGVLEDTFSTAFKKYYKVVGTPTFLILSAGKERSRFLGLADEKSLKEFLLNARVFS